MLYKPNGSVPKYVCNREVGSPKSGWRMCLALAKYRVSRGDVRTRFYELHYCERHRPPKSELIREPPMEFLPGDFEVCPRV